MRRERGRRENKFKKFFKNKKNISIFKIMMEKVKDILLNTINEFLNLKQFLNGDNYTKAVDAIHSTIINGDKIVLLGIGKNLPVCNYMSKLFISLNVMSVAYDANELQHGTFGGIKNGDIIIALSNSGETKEILDAINYIKTTLSNTTIISVTKDGSTLSELSDFSLCYNISDEGGPLKYPPKNSILIQTFILQTLCTLLEEKLNISLDEYKVNHYGGNINKLISEKKREETINLIKRPIERPSKALIEKM